MNAGTRSLDRAAGGAVTNPRRFSWLRDAGGRTNVDTADEKVTRP